MPELESIIVWLLREIHTLRLHRKIENKEWGAKRTIFFKKIGLKLKTIKWEKRGTFVLILFLTHPKDNNPFTGDKQASVCI